MNLSDALNNYIQRNFTSPDESVYHYTSPRIADIIRQCQHLKFSSHKFLNEKNEENLELSLGIEIVKEHLKKSVSKNNTLYKFSQFFDEGALFYTASFCHEKDSQHAIQTYGTSRIEFSPGFLNKFTNDNKATLFGNVNYDTKKQKEIIADMFDIYAKYKDLEEIPEALLVVCLTEIIPLFKHEKHHKDSECRIVQAEIWKNGNLMSPQVSKRIEFEDHDVKYHP